MTVLSKQPALPGMPAAKAVKKPMSKHVLAMIQAAHPEAFGHKVHWQQCHRCRADVLQGFDWTEDWAGQATVDATALDTVTELAALMDGRRTYEFAKEGTDLVLRSRDQWRIGRKRPESLDGPVMPAHKCNTPIGVPLPRNILAQRKAL